MREIKFRAWDSKKKEMYKWQFWIDRNGCLKDPTIKKWGLFSPESIGWILIIILLGALVGSALGEVLGLILPEGVVKEFFLRSADFGVGPGTLNLVVFSFTLGFTLKVNVIGVIGIGLVAYFLRWAQ